MGSAGVTVTCSPADKKTAAEPDGSVSPGDWTKLRRGAR